VGAARRDGPERHEAPEPGAREPGVRELGASDPSPPAGSLGRRFAPAESNCEFCGHAALDRHCKVVCPRCGAVRDCSDP
jgi:hypothetical protein